MSIVTKSKSLIQLSPELQTKVPLAPSPQTPRLSLIACRFSWVRLGGGHNLLARTGAPTLSRPFASLANPCPTPVFSPKFNYCEPPKSVHSLLSFC